MAEGRRVEPPGRRLGRHRVRLPGPLTSGRAPERRRAPPPRSPAERRSPANHGSVLRIAFLNLAHDHGDCRGVDIRPLHQPSGPFDIIRVDGVEKSSTLPMAASCSSTRVPSKSASSMGLCPVLYRQPRHPRKVPDVVCHEGASKRNGVGRDENVKLADGRPAFGEEAADPSEFGSRFFVEGHHLDRARERIDQVVEFPGPLPIGAVPELRQRDRADTDIGRPMSL